MLHAKVAADAQTAIVKLRRNTVCVNALDIFAHMHGIDRLDRRQPVQIEKYK